MSLEVLVYNGEIFVKFNYNPEIIRDIKIIGGGTWSSIDKSWRFIYSEDKHRQLVELKNQYDLPHGNNVVLDRLTSFENLLKLKGYSSKTIKSYLGHMRRFIEYINGDIESINYTELEKYSLFLLDDQKSHSYVNQGINSIKFYLKNINKDDQILKNIVRPKKEKRLPNILSEEEVFRVLNALDNQKHKVLLMLTYSAGLRVSEVAKIKVCDIDSGRMLLRISQGKGRKDRYTILSSKLLEELRKYYKQYRPKDYLFQGQNGEDHITERSVQRVFKSACQKAKISKKVGIHSLRHSFATHLLEQGTDLRYIQELLGHSSSKTKEIYTHVTNRIISKIVSPLDRM